MNTPATLDLDEWIKFYSPENMKSVQPGMQPVPAYTFLVELKEARARSAWRPIETAPEGEHILLWFPRGERGNGGMEAATIYRDDPMSKSGFSFWTHGGPNSGVDWDSDEAPTLWQPLPDAPKGATVLMFAHRSDCAIFNEPAMRSGPCDCGFEEPRKNG